MSIQELIQTIQDPQKDYTGRTKAERMRALIDHIKTRDSIRGKDMCIGELLFRGVWDYRPLYRYKGCPAYKTIEEIMGVVEERRTK